MVDFLVHMNSDISFCWLKVLLSVSKLKWTTDSIKSISNEIQGLGGHPLGYKILWLVRMFIIKPYVTL